MNYFSTDKIGINQHPSIMKNTKETLKVDLIVEGLSHPTSMAFVDNATILVLEKDSGNIRVISNGVLKKEPVLQINVDSTGERGLLGIAVLKKEKQECRYNNDNSDDDNDDQTSSEMNARSIASLRSNSMSTSPSSTYHNCFVFIYFTQKNPIKVNATDGDQNSSNNSLRNVIYKYDWDSKSLINPKLLVALPAEPGPYHNGGKLKIGPDNQLYAVIRDLTSPNGILQNHYQYQVNNNGTPPLMSSSSVIVRIDPHDGLPSKDNPFLKDHQNGSVVQMRSSGEGVQKGLDYYYAYGIRNSFGLAFDPIIEKLWDTENGEKEYDEINVVNPGFNSGWHKIMGPKSRNDNISDPDLMLLNGAHYSDPIFSWKEATGVTDIEFFNSSKLGNEYTNNLFVGDINNGNLYFFKVNDTRTGINFDSYKTHIDSANNASSYTDNRKTTNNPPLSDLVADNPDELSSLIFAKGFNGRITDIETGPDGNLHILTYTDGRIYKIGKDGDNSSSNSRYSVAR
jgi:glucose/arabinose dehydrogenase